MELGLRDRAVLLVGASRGIGGAAALAFAREGARLALVARDARQLEERADACRRAGSPQVVPLAADATDPRRLEQAVAQAGQALGGLDVLVTLVGGSQPGGTAEADDALWEQAFDKNLWPAARATRLALPLLVQAAARRAASAPPAGEQPRLGAEPPPHDTGPSGTQPALPRAADATTLPHLAPAAAGPLRRGGSVVLHVASIWGREGGGTLTYNAAKAALIALAHAQARELAPQGVRVLSLAPGSTLHPGGSWERRLQRDPAGTNAFVQREIPFGRFGTAEEVGDVIAFLCSPRASWVAGTCVVVDGAQSRSF